MVRETDGVIEIPVIGGIEFRKVLSEISREVMQPIHEIMTASNPIEHPETNGSKHSRRENSIFCFVITFLTVQIAVPVYLLFGEKPVPFGWQMFAGVAEWVDYEIHTSDGEVIPVENKNIYFGNPRGDLITVDHLPQFLCDQNPEYERVVIINRRTAETETCKCP